ncbi:MAG: Trehalose/maltose import ATP-binding protein MalK [Methanoregula sp. PtaU1.Bin051]|nr:MAG: Trehalose/maltose import ATP-binding protein MalK [Methanoregula sp. PtaU1.Bin051]
MRICLNRVQILRDDWFLSADGRFCEGTHLVSGRIGSGKSTLALVMAGLFSPTSGTIEYEGSPSTMLSLQFPEYHVTGSTLIEECLSWGLDPSRILLNVELEDRPDSDPLSLSRGELKRLHLACVLEQQNDILLLDEPFSALDCDQKMRLCNQLSKRTSGITVIFTHEQEFLPPIDRYWEIREGNLMDLGRSPGDGNQILYYGQKQERPET